MQKSQMMKMKIELTDEEIELINNALLDLACMCERNSIFDNDQSQRYDKAYRAFDDAVCKASVERFKGCLK